MTQPNTEDCCTAKGLLKISIPLMITWLSTLGTMFVDRFLLAQYSLDALGAAVNAGTLAFGFTYGFQLITEMSQVVIGQYKGNKQLNKIAPVTWQMIWMSLFGVLLFAPLSLWGGTGLFASHSSHLHTDYFRWLLIFGPAYGMLGALAGFFIGQGRSKIVTQAAIVGNLINLVLDVILIFGIEGWIPSMGVKGAALATGIGTIVQAAILFVRFTSNKEHRALGLSKWQVNTQELIRCLRVGLPPGSFLGLELIGWGIFFSLVAMSGPDDLHVISICHSLLPLFSSFHLGIQKGISASGAQLIGAGKMDQLDRLLKVGFKLVLTYAIGITTLTVLLGNHITALFVEAGDPIWDSVRLGLVLSCFYLTSGTIRGVLVGALSAAADTMFLMVSGTISVWALLIAPTYLLVAVGDASVMTAQIIMACYGFSAAAICYWRFRSERWTAKALVIETI